MTGDDLKGIIINAGLTQIEFAEMLDVNLSTVKRWLNDSSEIPGSVYLLARLIDTRQITPPQLIDFTAQRRLERIPA